ncbi:MAG: hypothetical protein ACRCUJ_14255 [Phocaeicola sp.]
MNILIVEDEAGIYNFLKEGLEEEGYDITIAPDGIKGVDKFFRSKPDLVLLYNRQNKWYFFFKTDCTFLGKQNLKTK